MGAIFLFFLHAAMVGAHGGFLRFGRLRLFHHRAGFTPTAVAAGFAMIFPIFIAGLTLREGWRGLIRLRHVIASRASLARSVLRALGRQPVTDQNADRF